MQITLNAWAEQAIKLIIKTMEASTGIFGQSPDITGTGISCSSCNSHKENYRFLAFLRILTTVSKMEGRGLS